MASKITWHIEKRKLKELFPYEKNPRQLSEKQAEHLKTSLDKFGLIDKPCVNLNGIIIGGHQRINVLNLLPNDKIEVMVPDRLLEDHEVEELNIRLNGNQGSWDHDLLANEFDIDDLVDWGLEDLKIISETLMLADEVDEKLEKKKKKSKICPHCGEEI